MLALKEQRNIELLLGFNAKLNNLEHFKKTGAIDEHTRSRFLVGDESQYDSISGFDDLIAVNAKFFPEGSDAKLTVNNYFENLDGSLGHGSFYYSRTVKGKKIHFHGTHLLHWVGNKITLLEISADFGSLHRVLEGEQ